MSQPKKAPATASNPLEVFTCRQYSGETLKALHRDLRENPLVLKRGTWERLRLSQVVEEMERRGMLVERKHS